MTALALRARPSGYVHLVKAATVKDANYRPGLGHWPRHPVCDGRLPVSGWTDVYPPGAKRCPECFPAVTP